MKRSRTPERMPKKTPEPRQRWHGFAVAKVVAIEDKNPHPTNRRLDGPPRGS